MRIALVSHYMPPHTGGVEQVAALLARVYADAGHEVTWVACAAPLPAGEEHETHVRRVRIAANNGLEGRFALPFPIPTVAGWRSIGEIVAGTDIVHLHDCLYPTSVAAARAAHIAGRPALVTQHVGMVSFGGGLVDPFLAAAYRTVGARILRRARHVAFVSDGVRDWFAGHVTGPIHGSVVPNAVDTFRFRVATDLERGAIRDRFGLARDELVVLFAGRLVPKKNIRALVDAMSGVDAHLFVVGDGPERGALRDLGTRVTHVPRIAHERMHEVYAAADLFALPSKGEGLPVSLIEALASGLPCVLSDDPAFDGLTACPGVIRVPVARLGPAITAALGGRALATSALATRAWAEERYGVDAFRERYLALATEVAGS